jgi:hypothetical protein
MWVYVLWRSLQYPQLTDSDKQYRCDNLCLLPSYFGIYMQSAAPAVPGALADGLQGLRQLRQQPLQDLRQADESPVYTIAVMLKITHQVDGALANSLA